MCGWLTAAAVRASRSSRIAHLRIRRGQHGLDRDRTLQPLVDRFVHDSHTASPDQPDDAVVADSVRHVSEGLAPAKAGGSPWPQ